MAGVPFARLDHVVLVKRRAAPRRRATSEVILTLPPKASDRPSPWTSLWARRTYVAVAFWAAGAAVDWLTAAPTPAPGWLRIRLDGPGILFLIASAVGGWNFIPAGFRAARKLKLDMSFLMGAAVIAAVLIGDSFEAATLAALFSFAELLERYAVDRSRRSIALLLELAPERAELIRADGSTENVAAESLKVGDRIRVRPGDRIAADGAVASGSSSVNEAALTGESIPVAKQPGDQVFSGTLNIDGALDVAVSSDAAHSVLARIVTMVHSAEQRRAPIEQTVQRFAKVYTPAATALAVLVMIVPPLLGMGSGMDWFLRGITLLVIACPCALVIATPVTVVSALTSAARHGVLIKGGEHLERLGRTKALATDKTGTLTKGELEVKVVETRPPEAATELLALAAAVEGRSEHPVARAIVRHAGAGARPIEVTDFGSKPGHGVTAVANGVRVTLGTEAMVGPEAASRWTAGPEALTWVYLETGDGRSARIGLADRVRPEAKPFIAELHAQGIRPIVLLTGDRAEPAEAVAREVGVDQVRARLLPADKVAAVQALRNEHGWVAMIGDGVNDAPALAEASVGIAMGAAGSPATIETADVALMADDLSRIPYAVRLARMARRTVRFNIGVALLLKVGLAVGAVLGVVSLAVAVTVGDMGGSLLVTLNAIRLAHVHPPEPGGHRDQDQRAAQAR